MNSNGTVVSRIGSAAVAMMADAAGVPVIICCETYKFSNKVANPGRTSLGSHAHLHCQHDLYPGDFRRE